MAAVISLPSVLAWVFFFVVAGVLIRALIERILWNDNR
jgi:hypothetical protein